MKFLKLLLIACTLSLLGTAQKSVACCTSIKTFFASLCSSEPRIAPTLSAPPAPVLEPELTIIITPPSIEIEPSSSGPFKKPVTRIQDLNPDHFRIIPDYTTNWHNQPVITLTLMHRRRGSTPIGYITATAISQSLAKITNLEVTLKDDRGHGCGSRLLKAMLNFLQTSHFTKVQLTAQPFESKPGDNPERRAALERLIKLYTKHGFKELEKYRDFSRGTTLMELEFNQEKKDDERKAPKDPQ
jgi:GNAT superfamily N-acetyltransferase